MIPGDAATRDIPASCICGWSWLLGRHVRTRPVAECPWHSSPKAEQ
jgi:hypothetical protein